MPLLPAAALIWSLLALAMGAAAGCSCAAVHEAPVDAGTDVGPSDAGADAFSRCPPVTELPAPCGNCDGMGRASCMEWAFDEIHGLPQRDGGWTAYAECVQLPATGCCARASDVIERDGGVEWRCGAQPPCGAFEVCASRFDGDPPSCLCIADAP